MNEATQTLIEQGFRLYDDGLWICDCNALGFAEYAIVSDSGSIEYFGDSDFDDDDSDDDFGACFY